MPVVPKDALHYHRHLFHARSPVPIAAAVTEERDFSQGLGHLPLDGNVQLNSAYGLSAFIFLCVVILGYLFRRHIRSVPSRLASSVHATPVLNLIHIHLHTARHYFPLRQDADAYETPSSPVTESPISSPIQEHGPAPPYSNMKKGEERAKNLQITVPPRQSTFTRQLTQYGAKVDIGSPSGSSIASTPSFLSDAGSSCGGPSPLSTPISVLSATLPEQNQYRSQHQQEAKFIESKSETGVLGLASPRASKWDAFSGYISNSNHHDKDGSNPLHNFNGARRGTDIMNTDSPCATPPPQYTITIHSGQRSREQSSDSESGGIVPDIILSPVPWMPKEYNPPPSPPCYLAVPPRKRKSRHQFTTPVNKPLPYIPRQKPSPALDTEVKARQAFKTETVNEKAIPSVSLARSASNPSPNSSVPSIRPHHVPRRSNTLPLPHRAPAPKPILPLELEAVYPINETFDNDISDKEESSWLWRSRSPSRTPAPIRQTLAGGRMPSVSEKTGFLTDEKREKDESDDDVPLAKGLIVAMRRKKDGFAARAKEDNRTEVKVLEEKATVFRKQFFGRLSALAAKAKSTIEQQFDSSDSETEEEEEMAPVVRGRSDAHFYHEEEQREAERMAREAFVIGDDDFEE